MSGMTLIQGTGKYMWLLTFLLAAGIEHIRDNIILAIEHIKADFTTP